MLCRSRRFLDFKNANFHSGVHLFTNAYMYSNRVYCFYFQNNCFLKKWFWERSAPKCTSGGVTWKQGTVSRHGRYPAVLASQFNWRDCTSYNVLETRTSSFSLCTTSTEAKRMPGLCWPGSAIDTNVLEDQLFYSMGLTGCIKFGEGLQRIICDGSMIVNNKFIVYDHGIIANNALWLIKLNLYF